MKTSIILIIRNFIIGFKFQKYGHLKTRYDELKQQSLKFLTALFAIRQLFAYSAALNGAIQLRQIQLQPAKTKEEKQKKAFAVMQSIINTNLGIIKAYNTL